MTRPTSCSRRTFLKKSVVLSAGVVAASSLPCSSFVDAGLAAPPEKPQPAFGYDNTPQLPDSPWRVHDRRRPQPPLVTPADQPGGPPSDAVVLFDGKDLSQWEGAKPEGVENGTINIRKSGEIRSKQRFGDCQLHVEWMTPEVPDGNAMNWGNSGVFLMDQFEVQIIESHDCHIYADGNSGAIYGQSPPLVNASRKPGQWQTFDIVFIAPRFEGKKLLKPAYITVFHNGVLVQCHEKILGATVHLRSPSYESTAVDGPIRLQYHSSAVHFRNIWVRRLKSADGTAAASQHQGR